MSSGNWSMKNPVSSGETIYALTWNEEFLNVIANCNPDGVGTASENLVNMQAVLDPFPSGSPLLSDSLRQELQELRFQISSMIGKTYWYEVPETNLNNVSDSLVTNGDAHTHISGDGALIGTDAIEDEAITGTKYSPLSITDASIADNAIITRNINDNSVTLEKLALSAKPIAQYVFLPDYVTHTVTTANAFNISQVPTNAGGTLVIEHTFTPYSGTGYIEVEAFINYYGTFTSVAQIVSALFTSYSTNAFSASCIEVNGENSGTAIVKGVYYLSSTTPFTISLKMSCNVTNLTLNGLFGSPAINASYLKIVEHT